MGKLSTLSTDTTGKLDVLGHVGDTLGVDSTQVGVLKEADEVSLTGLLEGHNSRALESEVSLEILGNLSDKTLEGELADEKLSGLLVPSDLMEGNSSRPVPVWLLDSAGGKGRTCEQPWWPAASWGLCLQWTYGRFAWYGPFCYSVVTDDRWLGTSTFMLL